MLDGMEEIGKVWFLEFRVFLQHTAKLIIDMYFLSLLPKEIFQKAFSLILKLWVKGGVKGNLLSH